MQLNLRREVFIDTEVSISVKDITTAIQEAANDEASKYQATGLLVMCWQALSAFTDEQIQLVGAANSPHIAKSLRDLAERFEQVK